MGILRGLGKAFGGFLFTTFLVSAISMITIVQFTEYDNLKSLVSPFLENTLRKEINVTQINQTYSLLLLACQEREKIELSVAEENVTLDCTEIRTIKPGNLTSLIASKTFDKIYFKQYDCEFVQCLREGEDMLILFSLKANEFFKNIQNLLWIGTAIGAIILFVSVKTWQGRFKAFGTACLFTAIPFFFFGHIKNLVLSQLALPTEILALALPIMDKIIASISSNFLFILIAGIVLTSCSYLLEYFLKKRK